MSWRWNNYDVDYRGLRIQENIGWMKDVETWNSSSANVRKVISEEQIKELKKKAKNILNSPDWNDYRLRL